MKPQSSNLSDHSESVSTEKDDIQAGNNTSEPAVKQDEEAEQLENIPATSVADIVEAEEKLPTSPDSEEGKFSLYVVTFKVLSCI